MIEIAREKANAQNIKNITFKHLGIDEFSASDQTFDAVLGLSILHLLDNKEEVIEKVHKMLKPGGIFVSNTACLRGILRLVATISPIGNFLGFMPLVEVFTVKELKDNLINTGFEIDYEWQPGKN